jgi:hypothetical protein
MAAPRPWLFATVYALHLLDEGLAPPGLAAWGMAQGYYFTFGHWLSVSLLSFVLFGGALWLVARGTWPPWVLVALAAHVALHALLHVGASLWASSLSPGTATGVLLALPLAAVTFEWGRAELRRPLLLRALLLGAATFQAPWDLAIRLAFGLRVWVS